MGYYEFQSLFYWIINSYEITALLTSQGKWVSILILLDYQFLYEEIRKEDYVILGFNPYFTGLSILIGNDENRSVKKS